MLTDTLGHRHAASEESLLIIAENLLHREVVSGRSKAADAGRHHYYVLLASVDSFESPAQVGERVVISHWDQHGEAVEGETPDHAKSVGFAKDIDVSAAGQDGQKLESNHHVDDAGTGAVFAMWKAKPVGEHSVFGNAVQNAVRSDDGRVDRAR